MLPEFTIADEVTVPTVTLGVPVSPEATVAVAALPVQVVAVAALPEQAAAVVAVAALPVQLPALPVTLPVTLPVSGPEKPAAITVPVERMDPETSREYAGVIVPMPT